MEKIKILPRVFIKLAVTNFFFPLDYLVLAAHITFISNDMFRYVMTSWYLKKTLYIYNTNL